MNLRSINVYLVGLILLLSVTAQGVSSSSSEGDATFIRITENGPVLVHEPGLPVYSGSSMTDDPAVVWSYNLIDAIYNTTSNTVDGYVFAGTYLNNPWEAELFAPTGGGTPEWAYGGTEFYTDAGDNAFTLAAVDAEGGGVNVIKWTGPGNGTPDWVTNFLGYGISGYGPCAVSDDGSTIAAIAAPAGTDAHLLLFDADSATPLIDYTATGCGFPRYLKINADGRYPAFIALATLIVFDRDSLNVRDQISMGFSNSAMDISGDGDLLAYGWQYMQVMEWNGTEYVPAWTYSIGTEYYVTRIAISADGSTIVSCWNRTTLFNTIRIIVHEAGSSTPLWTYDYPVSSGAVQEAAYDVETTDDGSYFIVGSLGDSANINPEVHIFQRDNTPHIFYTVDMPGSMFSVDIASDGSYATAAGKHVHANTMGRGGDVVLINLGLTGIETNDVTQVQQESPAITCSPNPFVHSTAIRYSILNTRYSIEAGNEVAHVKIYDAAGKLVKSLYQVSSIQDQGSTVFWDGTDSFNRKLPGGVYFARLGTENSITTEKIVKLE
jgi:hypothetical protein